MTARRKGARASLALALVALLLLPLLAACGKRGEPVPPEGVPHTYPRTYPRG